MEFQVRYLALFLLFSIIDCFEWFWMESPHKNIQLMLEFLKAPFFAPHFSYYTLMTFLMMLSVILLSMLMIIFSILNVIGHLTCGNNLNWLLNLNLIYETLWIGAEKGLLILIMGKLNWFRLTVLITLVLLMWKWMGLFLRKNHLLRFWGWLSLLNWIGAPYIISTAKTATKKVGALIRSMKFLSPEVALYLYKSTIHPCMEYCYVWAGAPSCYLELLDKLQKRICWTVGPSLATSLEPLAHRWNVASLSLFYRYYFGRCSSELAQLVPLLFSWGRSTRYSDRFHDFSITIPRCYKDVYVNSFFPRTARLWNSLPIECFHLTYNLNGFKSRINRHLLTVGSF